MASVEQYINLGIAGVAVYFMYSLTKQALEGLKVSIDNNTAIINELKIVVSKLSDQIGKSTG